MSDRAQFIGSSDIAAIIGLAPEYGGKRRTAYDVWLEKTCATAEPIETGRARFLARRKSYEPVVLAMLREELDAEIVATNVRHVDSEIPYLSAEVDAEVLVDGETVEVEVKTVHPRAFGERFGWGEPGTGDVPVHYEAQRQFALGVTGRRRSFVAALVGLDDLLLYPIERDEDSIKRLREAAERFWTAHVLTGTPPNPQTAADLAKLYPAHKDGLEIEAASEIGAKALRLRAIQAQIEALGTEADALVFEVKLAMRDAERLRVDGRTLYTWKAQTWSRLDTEALKAEAKDIYKRFLRTGTQRVFKRTSWT